jgi:phospholipid-transporting ATPase
MLIGTYTTLFDSPLIAWSTLIPLVIVLVITMTKEGLEDLKRHKADRDTNNRRVKKVSDTKDLEEVHWHEVRVGDLIYVQNNEEIAADMILLATSDSSGGSAFVETANIDGETNLKMKKSTRTTKTGSVWKEANELKK